MYYAYVLKSCKTGRLYKGSCEDLDIRLRRHNTGFVRSTRPYRPWILLHSECFETRGEAVQREHFWKSATGARELRRLLPSGWRASECAPDCRG